MNRYGDDQSKSGHSNGSIDLEGSLVALTLAMLEAHNCANVHT